jgi:sulfide:quinone oxidoreductase
MDRILVLGGGVGGTLAANLLARKLKRRIDAGSVALTLVDEGGEHVYQPGFMYIAMGGERADKLHRPERSLLDRRIQLVIARRPGSTPMRAAWSSGAASRSRTTTS